LGTFLSFSGFRPTASGAGLPPQRRSPGRTRAHAPDVSRWEPQRVRSANVTRVQPRTFRGITDLLLAPGSAHLEACAHPRRSRANTRRGARRGGRGWPLARLRRLPMRTAPLGPGATGKSERRPAPIPFRCSPRSPPTPTHPGALSRGAPRGRTRRALPAPPRVPARSRPPPRGSALVARQRSCSLSGSARQITPPTRNGHAPPAEGSRKSFQSVHPDFVLAW